MQDGYREINLEELARSRGYNSLPYRQYAELKGRAMILDNLEKSLREACDILPYTTVNKPPEMELFELLLRLKNEVETLKGKTYHRLGIE
jgi:hypothetical protein